MKSNFSPKPAALAATLTAADRMYAEIYDAIMGLKLSAKTKLTEKDLCEIYGLPRHQVRQVLAKLEADGLVDIKANRGAFIANPSEREAQEMFEVRSFLECALLEKIASSLSTESCQRLTEMVAQEQRAWSSGDREGWIRLSAQFHVALAELSGNEILVAAIKKYVSRTTLMISGNHPTTSGSCSFDEHRAILDALQRRDAAAAVSRMREHLHHCAIRTPQKPQRLDLRNVLGKNKRPITP
jgi:DNA-binding GntR family transcriptional regulator